MKRCDKITKTIQRRVYDFLLTKYGLALIVAGALLMLVSMLQLSDTILEYKLHEYENRARTEPSRRNKSPHNVFDNHADYYLTSSEHLRTNIDAVYTWVNGSDPAHAKTLREYKLKEFESWSARAKQTLNLQISFEQFYAKFRIDSSEESAELSSSEPASDWPCFHKLCMQTNNLIIVLPQLSQADKQSFLSSAKAVLDPQFYSNISIDNVNKIAHNRNEASQLNSKKSYGHDSGLSILSLNSYDFKSNKLVLDQMRSLFRTEFLQKNYSLYMGYYTIDCSLALNCVQNVERTFIVKRIKSSSLSDDNFSLNPKYSHLKSIDFASLDTVRLDENRIKLPKYIEDNLFYKLDYAHMPAQVFDGSKTPTNTISKSVNKQSTKRAMQNNERSKDASFLSVFKVKTRELDSNLSKYLSNNDQHTLLEHTMTFYDSDALKNVTYDVYRANIVWDLGDPYADDIAAHRFQDNDELKYSLRSVEKYAPWIRRIYLVTNGQVPDWLNTSHPKIRLVKHEDIFVNSRTHHLPTFSSPAIESNLHHIESLSTRFLYFNDDLLLGAPVFPDDFYTHSKGFRFRLSWSLPGCNPNCPNSWIRDGYCDKACNTTECDFDGGDCQKSKKNNLQQQQQQQQQNNNFNLNAAFKLNSKFIYAQFYCAPGCSTSWLADRYCDKACDNFKCAYDMGDCGTQQFTNEIAHENLFSLDDSRTISAHNESLMLLKHFSLPKNVQHFYFNFSQSLPNSGNATFRIDSANYEENKRVRSISAVNKFHTLTILFVQDENAQKPSNNNSNSNSSNNNNNIKKDDDNSNNNSNASSNKIVIYIHGSFGQEKSLNLSLVLSLVDSISNSTLDLNRTKVESNFKPIEPNVLSTNSSKIVPVKSLLFNEIESKPNENRFVSNRNDSRSRFASHISPHNAQFSSRFFKSLYANYHDYLQWSKTNNYLTESGLNFKLNAFYEMLNREAKHYETIEEAASLNDQDLGKLFDLVFKSENGLFLNEADKDELINEYLNATTNSADFSSSSSPQQQQQHIFVQFKKRKLLDTFADSLRHVNRLFNQVYGYMPRKVPAHIPHYIDKEIMHELQSKFEREFDATSANRFRSSTDMQYAFAYYYYVMSEPEEFEARKLFDELDLNMNRVLDAAELIIVNLKLSPRPFAVNGGMYARDAPASHMFTLNSEFESHLNNCLSVSNETVIRREPFSTLCQSLVDYLREGLWSDASSASNTRHKYKYEALSDDETKFVMIGGDSLSIQVKLSNLIRDMPKFVCLNDNIDYKLKAEAQQLRNVLRNFYSTMFPLKSSFELDNDSVNKKVVSSFGKKSLNENTFAASKNTGWFGRGLIFLVIAVFVFCVYCFKKLLFDDNDDDDEAKKRRNDPVSARRIVNLTRKSPFKARGKHRDYSVSNVLRRNIEENHLTSSSSSSSSSSDSCSTSSNSCINNSESHFSGSLVTTSNESFLNESKSLKSKHFPVLASAKSGVDSSLQRKNAKHAKKSNIFSNRSK